MFTTRRQILAFAGSTILSKLRAAPFDVDRLIGANSTAPSKVHCRRYAAAATITLFSVPLVSRSGVGSGYTVIEEARGSAGTTIAIQFGAGSYPESARGLNRLGFIQEAIVESRPGEAAECAYLAFMTTSRETSLDQAKKALEDAGSTIPYTAAQGRGRAGTFAARVDRLEFPSHYTWRDIPLLIGKARELMSSGSLLTSEREGSPATFLYVVRRALLDPETHTSGRLFFNGKQFLLETEKVKDPAAGAQFAAKKLSARPEAIMRLNAVITELRTGVKTPFRLWYQAGAEGEPPLRFEYQAKSFLRLTFEAGAEVTVPPIRFALSASKENA